MGYELHVTRQDEWLRDNISRTISFEEWVRLVESDKEMRLNNYVEATATAGEFIRIESEGLSV